MARSSKKYPFVMGGFHGEATEREGHVDPQPRSSNGTFQLTSLVVEDGAELPKEFTGVGAGISPPLAWKGTPTGTVGFALLMDHVNRKQPSQIRRRSSSQGSLMKVARWAGRK